MVLTDQGVEATPSGLLEAEAEMLQDTGAVGVLWCGRGATALYFACKVARNRQRDRHRTEMIIPATTCISVPWTCLLAGLTPRFADIDPSDGILRLETVKERANERTCAVVPTHLYGQTAQLDAI